METEKKFNLDNFLTDNWANEEKRKNNKIYVKHNITLLKTIIRLLNGEEVSGVKI